MNNIVAYFRSFRFWSAVLAVVIIGIISFVYFYPDAMQGNVLRQHDIQQGMAIGQEAKAFAEATGESTRWTNSLFSGMPTFQIAPSYPSNSLFTWINTVMGLGLPSPANLLAMMMLGFFILLMTMKMRWYVALIGAIAYGFSSYFIIIIGAGHIWKFVTLAYVPPTIAGVVLCYRGRYLAGGALAALFAMMQISSNHVQMSYYFLFVIIGFAVAYLISAVRDRKMRRWCMATGVLVVAALLAVTANLPSLYNTYEYSKETIRGAHSELAQPASAGSENVTSGLSRDYITQYSYGEAESFSLLIPNVKGGASVKPEKGGNRMLNLSDLPQAKAMVAEGELSPQESQYLEYISQYFGEPEGTNGPVYVGALIVVLFLIGCVIIKGPMKWVLLILTLLSVMLALGRNCMWLTDLMIDYMPMYNKFRTVESILVIAEFTMPLLAVMALQKLLTEPDAWTRYKRQVMWCFGIVLVLCLAGVIVPGIYGSAISDNDRQIDAYITQSLLSNGMDRQTVQMFSLNNPRIYHAIEELRYSMVEDDAMRSFIIVGSGMALLLLFFYRKISMVVTVAGIAVVVCCDLFLVNKRYLDTESFVPRSLAMGDPFPMSAADAEILADKDPNFRVMNLPEFWQAAPSYRHKMIGGYHAAKLTRYQDLIDRHLGNFLKGSETDADWNVLDMLNAKYIVDFSGQVLRNDEAMGNAWFVDRVDYVNGADAEMNALSAIDPRTTAVADSRFRDILGESAASQPGDTIYATSYAPNELTYEATTANGGVAVFSEIYFPWGWQVSVDGHPAVLGRVNYVLRALQLPAGKHTITMRFDPPSLRNTGIAATIAIILIYVALGAGLVLWAMRLGTRKDDEQA